MVRAPRRSLARRSRKAARRGEQEGYTLVALVVAVTVLTILFAAIAPAWEQALKRSQEEELIFRGLQYAEAIRVFQRRFGRYPLRLEELLEVQPRSIRRLWRDPMTESGEWGVVYASLGAGLGGHPPGQDRPPGSVPGGPVDGEQGGQPNQQGQPGQPGQPGQRAPGTWPIVGVYSTGDGTSVKTFMGSDSYGSWRFTVEMVELPKTAPGGVPTPRIGNRWVGRPFPGVPQLPAGQAGLPQQGQPPH